MMRRRHSFSSLAVSYGCLLLACGHTNNSDPEPVSAAGSSTQAPACLYGEESYQEGETFADSDGCTLCECHDGSVACTRADCPQSPQCHYANPSGTTLGSNCVQHGDVDNCEVVEHACMPVK